MKIRYVLERKAVALREGRIIQYLAFLGESYSPLGKREMLYGVIDETAHNSMANTELENWQLLFTPSDGRLRRGPGVVRDARICPDSATAVRLVEGRKAVERTPSNQKLIRRLELLYQKCKDASGIFQPLAVVQQEESINGWLWTALKAEDEHGQIVGIVHWAPK